MYSKNPKLTVDLDVYWDTLAEVNEVRLALGLPTIKDMPVGISRSPNYCPIARALSNGLQASVSSTTVRFLGCKSGSDLKNWWLQYRAARRAARSLGLRRRGRKVYLSPTMKRFVAQFDSRWEA